MNATAPTPEFTAWCQSDIGRSTILSLGIRAGTAGKTRGQLARAALKERGDQFTPEDAMLVLLLKQWSGEG